ncbi:MAG: hypothetical protein QOH25_3436 [Acidobacteriota bacterium]|jgi:flagellar hook-associated protein FlgK|nr:hypothetical protein [Acidobacteriota bacterium]
MTKVVKKSNAWIILVIALAAVVFSAACSKNANTGNSTNSTNSTTTNKNSTTSSGGDATGSPTAALRAYYQAAMNKDVTAAKKYLSTGTIALLEEGAKKMGKSLDDAFKESAAQTNTTTMPEFSNEKISGDTATVDLKAQGATVTMPMVKEGGEWKLAMDKLIEDMKNSMGGGTKEPSDDDDKNDNDNHGGH